MSNNELRVPQDSIYSSQPLSELDQASSVPICTLGPFPQNTAYNPVDHNVFNLEQDQLLCSLLSLAKAVIQNIASQNKNASSVDGWEWLEQLIEAIFGKKGMRELQSDFKRLDIQYNHACGKLLSHGEIYFRCLDCDESHNTDSNGNVVICSGCFEKSNHKGHRVLMLKSEINSALACSCGISSLLSQKGFCSRHGASHDSVNEILAKLPVGFADRFLKSLKKAFYSVISLFELSERVQDEQGQEMLLALAQLAMEELLLFCTISYAEVNEALMVLLGILFRSPLLDGCNLLWHECNDLAKNDSGSSEPHRCTCSLLGLLFRFSSKLNEELQMKLNKILIDCAKDNDFKPFLCEEFTKYSQYIFFAGNQDCHGEYARSGLVNIQKQLYTSEVLREGVLRAGHFANLVKVMKTTAQDLYQNRNALYDIIESISTILSSFLSKKSGSATKLLTETGLIKDLLEVLYHLQLKTNNRHIIGIGVHEHQVDYGTISWTLKLENIATQALEMSFQLIAEYSEEDKAKLFDEFITSWRNYFGLISQGTQKKPALFNISLERVLVSAIFNHSQEVNENEVKSFFNRICEKSNASSTSEKALEGIVKRLGAIRYLHLIHDYNSASGLESYYGSNSLSFEKDILGVQLLSSTLESKNLYEILSRQFFSYEKELQAFLLEDVKALRIDDYLRAKLVVLEDFMNFLVFIMNDQTCIFNLTRSKEEETPYSRDVALRKYEKVVEKVLTNALLGQYWVDITTLKNTLATTLTETSQLEHIIKKLTVYDSKTRKIRIKDEYKDELDPYVFYKMPALQKEITHVMASKPSGKEKKIDLVSGKFNTEVPSYVKSAQKDLYESSLSGFLASFVSNFNDNLAPMTRPVLKLILTHLQLAVQAIQEGSEASVIVKKAAVSYLNQGFSENLASISKLKDLSDCESCIEKIQGLLKTFASKLGHEECEATERESSKEEVAASKKDLVSKRMQQMKEEFMKKQKLFMNKNSHLLGETSSEEKSPLDVNTQQDLVCQHCLEHLNEDSDIYGIPIYIGFTNNMYDTQSEAKFKRDDYPHRLKGEWWPVISSCMHYYHQKCYQTLYINSRASNEQPGNYFSNELETCCSLCKTLCNNFLPVNKVCCKETDMGSSHNEQNRNRHPKLFMSFSEKIDELIKDLRRRLGASPSELTSEENQVSSREIAKRAFSYFLETFYQSQNLQQQEKLYDLYQKFFKVYLSADSNANCSDIDSAISETMITGDVNTLIENPLKISNLAPKMIKLPSTYAEFNSAYFKKKCSRCNQFSKNLSTCLCLHCGKVVCLACCHTSESDRDFGNLNKHAKRYHLGSAMFLEIQRLTKTIICSPVNAVFPGEDVYVDEFGQPVQYMIKNDKKSVYTLDFNKFTLNPNFVEYVRNMVSTQGIAKEAFTVSKIYGYYTHDNVL